MEGMELAQQRMGGGYFCLEFLALCSWRRVVTPTYTPLGGDTGKLVTLDIQRCGRKDVGMVIVGNVGSYCHGGRSPWGSSEVINCLTI